MVAFMWHVVYYYNRWNKRKKGYNTDLKSVKITKEESSSAGVRRIKAILE